MTWTRPIDLHRQVEKLWDQGKPLAGLVTGDSLFPKRLVLKCPSSAELADSFDDARAWISELRAMDQCRIEMREFRHRVFGASALPHEAWIDTLEDAAALIGRKPDLARFRQLIDETRERNPRLLGWLAGHPLRALELSNEWSRLLDIVAWRQGHPFPGVHLRQVDLPGVHTKFIESYRGVLSELFDMVLPDSEIDRTALGTNRFARRYGFLEKPVRIRFRILDPERALLPGLSAQDVTLDSESFVRLTLPVTRVFITENEINFLAFPRVRESMVIFGGGYGFEMLKNAEWLSNCGVYYWGDIDTHGFAILDQLRRHVPHARSLLMDRATLLACEALWGEEEKQRQVDLLRLNREERALYDDLRDNRIRKNLRLEQERIGFSQVESALASLD